ncbi:MAG: DUF4870 domain-containing protein [Cyanobacteria bacterium HKST-UBA02]|nr:DUF4870 domain-containing protein [Cyanobacteria bacterium HKST-UBA02]
MDDDRSVPDKLKHNLPGRTNMLSVDYNLAGLLCYFPLMPINIVSSVLWLVTEPKENKFVRFHAMQSLMLLGVVIAGSIVVSILHFLTFIPFLGSIIGLGLGIISFVLWAGFFVSYILLMVKAHSREMFKLPYLGDLADQYTN